MVDTRGPGRWHDSTMPPTKPPATSLATSLATSQSRARSLAFAALGWAWWAYAAAIVTALTRKGLQQRRLQLRRG